MNANTLTWIILLVLSGTSYALRGGSAAGFILVAAGVKAGLVAWQFMDLRSAHPVWRLALFALLAVFLGLVALLAPAGS